MNYQMREEIRPWTRPSDDSSALKWHNHKWEVVFFFSFRRDGYDEKLPDEILIITPAGFMQINSHPLLLFPFAPLSNIELIQVTGSIKPSRGQGKSETSQKLVLNLKNRIKFIPPNWMSGSRLVIRRTSWLDRSPISMRMEIPTNPLGCWTAKLKFSYKSAL